MRVLVLIDNPSVFELDVEVLIHRVQCPSYRQIILQLHCHFSPHQILEIRKEQLPSTENPDYKNYAKKNWKTTRTHALFFPDKEIGGEKIITMLSRENPCLRFLLTRPGLGEGEER